MYSVCVCLLSVVIVIVMEWWSVEGQDTGSGVSKNGDHSRRTAIRVYCTAADNIQHTQNRTNELFVFKSSDTAAYTGLALKN